jgi:cytochrome P450
MLICKDIYNNSRVTKASSYGALQQIRNAYNIFNTIDRNAHRRKRKVIGQALSDRAVKEFEPTMKTHIHTFVKMLAQSQSARGSPLPVNMTDRCKRLGVDIVGELALGHQLNTQRDPSDRTLSKGIESGNWHNNILLQWPILKKLYLSIFLDLAIFRAIRPYLQLLRAMIRSRLKEGQRTNRDLYSIIAEAYGTGVGGNTIPIDIWAEMVVLFPAGMQ